MSISQSSPEALFHFCTVCVCKMRTVIHLGAFLGTVYIDFKAPIRQIFGMQYLRSKSAEFLLIRAVQCGWSYFCI